MAYRSISELYRQVLEESDQRFEEIERRQKESITGERLSKQYPGHLVFEYHFKDGAKKTVRWGVTGENNPVEQLEPLKQYRQLQKDGIIITAFLNGENVNTRIEDIIKRCSEELLSSDLLFPRIVPKHIVDRCQALSSRTRTNNYENLGRWTSDQSFKY